MAREEALLIGGNILPGGYRRIAFGKPGTRRDQSHCRLALKARGANRVPAGIVTATIFRQICFLGLQWPVHGIVGDVEEERPGRVLVADLADKADRLVHPIVGRVIAFGILVDRGDDVVVDDARREKVTGFAFEKSIETVEAAIGRPGRVGRHTVGRIVPLADRDGGVSGGAQGFGDGRRVERNVAEIARKARIVVGEPPGRHRMRVSPGQQGGARRRANRMRRIMREADPAAGERIDVGCRDLRAVTADIGPAHIVHQDDHDIWRSRSRAHRQIPVRLRFLAGASDLAGKARIGACLAGNGDVLRSRPFAGARYDWVMVCLLPFAGNRIWASHSMAGGRHRVDSHDVDLPNYMTKPR